MKLVIICGGVGSKIWPLSRENNPKHLAKLIGEKSLVQLNYEVLRKKYGAEDIFVQTNPLQAEIIKKQIPEIPEENFFVEPERRNHGPAMGLMAAKLFAIAPDEPYMIVQADVIRQPEDEFLAMIEVMDKLISREGKLMTGGIKLDRVVGGIDFMVPGEEVGGVSGMRVFRMKKWVGRDDTDRDDEGISGGQVFGHANHYAWTPRKMLEAYKRRAPEWYEPLVKIMEAEARLRILRGRSYDEAEARLRILRGRSYDEAEARLRILRGRSYDEAEARLRILRGRSYDEAEARLRILRGRSYDEAEARLRILRGRSYDEAEARLRQGYDEVKEVIREEYTKMPADPIEARVTKYELGEALVVECPFAWIDLGTWESVAEYRHNFQFSNSNLQENLLQIEGEGNFVRSKKFVATIGVSDLVVVETDDALLVMKKGEGNRVGQVVDWLKEKERKELL